MNLQWQISDYIGLRNRMETVTYYEKGVGRSYGYLIYQDLLWKTAKRWSGNFRLAWFHTDDFDTRIYTYENNVRFAYSIPFFYGKGIRSYTNLRVNIGRKISLWAKLARTWYIDQETIGSGWDEIKGNARTNFTFELIWEP